ncbi:MAG: family 43 glycosylhydrolase [Clostridia bacterium]|nr:family 43 glycosylhydrolase [Clostridia bacterium]
MKKCILLLVSILLAGLLCFAAGAEEPTVYVSGFGNDEAAGTADAPVKTLYAAFRALPNGGTVYLNDTVQLTSSTELPASGGLITVTSAPGKTGAIYMGGNILLGSAVKFENVKIVTTAKDLVFICGGNYACFGEGLTVTAGNSNATLPGITAGGSGAVPADGVYLEICSGSWYRIRGGARGTSSAVQTGDVTIVIRGGMFTNLFDLGGDTAVDGNASLYIYGGYFSSKVSGATAASITGNVTISVYGGSFSSGVQASRGGEIGGDLTFNIFTDTLKAAITGNGKIAGSTVVNTSASNKTVTGILTKTVLSETELSALQDADTAAIAAAAAAKLPASADSSRDMTPSGSTAKTVLSTTAVQGGDLNKDGKITLLDAIAVLRMTTSGEYAAVADINGDGKISVTDCIRILCAAARGETSLSCGGGENRISDTLKLYGGASVKGQQIQKGYALGTVSDAAYSLYSDVSLQQSAVVGLYFGCDTADDVSKISGYYFEVDTVAGTLALYRVTEGAYRVVAEKNLHLLSDTARIRVTYGASTDANAVQLYFEDNPLVDTAYPDFDLSLEKVGSAVGLYTENATASLPVCLAETVPAAEECYTNNIFEQFTDPEVFYEDGVYYFYGTRSSTQNKGVQCYSTTDFKTWKDEGFVLAHGNAFGDGVYKAANIVKYGEYYYMFYMARSTALDTSVTAYASATAPNGPFKNADKTALTSDSNFIGGQPFVDEDGQVYLIYARTTGGNKLYGAKITLADGKAAIDLSTETLLLSPTEEWENAKASVVECGFIVKHNGLYYLLYSGGNYNSTYGTGYATAKSPLGPYTKYAYNPILVSNDQAFGVGASTVFVSPDGSEHFIAYLRNFSPTVTRPLLTCIDRIRFVKDPNGGADILEIYGPTVTPQLLPSGIGKDSLVDYQYARFHW